MIHYMLKIKNFDLKEKMEEDYYKRLISLDIYSVLRELSKLSFNSDFCKNMAMIIHILKLRYRDINLALGAHDKESWCVETEKEIEYFIRLNKNIKRKLGEGSFASAYLGSDGFVYKLNTKPKEYDSWLDYAYYSTDVDNQFFPKIYEIKTFKNTYCVKVEKLQPIKYEEYNNEYLELKDAFKKDDLNSIIKILSSNESDIPKIKEWYSISSKIKQETGAIWDIRFDNFLKRNEQLVINDPLAFGVSSNLNFK